MLSLLVYCVAFFGIGGIALPMIALLYDGGGASLRLAPSAFM